MPLTAPASTGCADSPRCCGSTWPGTDRGSVVVPGAVQTPLVHTVEIAGVDRDDPQVSRWVDRFSGHAVSPEKVADKILAGVAETGT